jgi:hypothetical protein
MRPFLSDGIKNLISMGARRECLTVYTKNTRTITGRELIALAPAVELDWKVQGSGGHARATTRR